VRTPFLAGLRGRGAAAALLFWISAYVAAGLIPLAWTFGKALVARLGDLVEISASLPAWAAFGRSAALGGMAAAGAFALAAPLAFFSGRTAIPGRWALSAAALAPLALPPYVIALALSGWLPSSPWLASGLVMVLSLYPIPFVFLRAGLASVDPALEEAGLLARGRGPTLRHITWPLVTPWAAAALVLVFLLGLGEYGAASFLGWNVYPGLIVLRFAATYDAAGAAIAALPLLAAVVLLLGIEARSLRRVEAVATRLRDPRLIELGRFRAPAFSVCLAILVASPGLPLLSLAGKVDRAGIERALSMAAGPAMSSIIVASTGCALAIATALAFALATRSGATALRGFPLLFFVLPGGIVGIGFIGFWNQPALPPLYGSIGLVVVALVLRYTVLLELSAEAGFRTVPRSQEEVARLAGRKETAIWGRILIPQIRTPLLAGATAFVLFAARDLDTVVTIYPPGGETLLVRLYTVLANSPEGLQAALALAQVGLTLPLVIVLAVLSRRSRWLY